MGPLSISEVGFIPRGEANEIDVDQSNGALMTISSVDVAGSFVPAATANMPRRVEVQSDESGHSFCFRSTKQVARIFQPLIRYSVTIVYRRIKYRLMSPLNLFCSKVPPSIFNITL